jgi:hypothetical protein
MDDDDEASQFLPDEEGLSHKSEEFGHTPLQEIGSSRRPSYT